MVQFPFEKEPQVKTFLIYWIDDEGDSDVFELDAPNRESAYETANAEWPNLTIIRVDQIS
jgi:hypothetical protein